MSRDFSPPFYRVATSVTIRAYIPPPFVRDQLRGNFFQIAKHSRIDEQSRFALLAIAIVDTRCIVSIH